MTTPGEEPPGMPGGNNRRRYRSGLFQRPIGSPAQRRTGREGVGASQRFPRTPATRCSDAEGLANTEAGWAWRLALKLGLIRHIFIRVPGGVVSRRLDALPQGDSIFIGIADAAAVGEPGDVFVVVPGQLLHGELAAVFRGQVSTHPGMIAPPGDVSRLRVHGLPLLLFYGILPHRRRPEKGREKGPKWDCLMPQASGLT